MDPNEIEYMYRHAKDPNSQIGILAELNGTTQYQICHVLYERGVLAISGYAKKYVALKMIHEHKGAGEIMQQAGISETEYARALADYPREKWIFSKEECVVHNNINNTISDKVADKTNNQKKVLVSTYKKEHELNSIKKELASAKRELADAKEIIRILKSEIRLIRKKI